MEQTELINAVKLRLGIADSDTSRDELIASYLAEVQEKVKNYCNISAVPEKLQYTIISITVDMYGLKNPSPTDRLVTEERQGNRTEKYAGKSDVEKAVSSYTAELNRYRRVRAV